MSSYLVLTVIGSDRPGLVQSLSDTIARHSGNWLESRMVRLAGQFAGVLQVEVPEAEQATLKKALGELQSQGLNVIVEASGEITPELGDQGLRLELVGQDRPGIVRDVSRVLSELGVNVEELVTECRSAPMSGETLFVASATLRIPAGLESATLGSALEQLANDLMVEIQLQEDE